MFKVFELQGHSRSSWTHSKPWFSARYDGVFLILFYSFIINVYVKVNLKRVLQRVTHQQLAPRFWTSQVLGEEVRLPLPGRLWKSCLIGRPPRNAAQISGQEMQVTGKTCASGTFGYLSGARLMVEIGEWLGGAFHAANKKAGGGNGILS